VLIGQPAAEIVAWLEAEGGTHRPQFAAVDVVACHRVVGIAVARSDRTCNAQGNFLADRHVDHALTLDRVVIAVGQRGIGLEFTEDRLARDDVHNAAGRVAAVERTLWTAQDFDALDVEIFLLVEEVRAERHIVLVDTDTGIRGLGDRVVTNAAEVAACELALREGHVGNGFHKVCAAGQLETVDGVFIESRNGDRNILDGLFGFLRGDRDGRQRAGRFRRVRVLSPGRLTEQSDCQRRRAREQDGFRVCFPCHAKFSSPRARRDCRPRNVIFYRASSLTGPLHCTSEIEWRGIVNRFACLPCI